MPTDLQMVVVWVRLWHGLMCRVQATAFHKSGWHTWMSETKKQTPITSEAGYKFRQKIG